MKWWHISIVLCTYGFFKEFRPSEPFISPYLTTFKNFTIQQINEDMFPVGTYSYLSLLILIFLLTDFLRYKPVLLTGSASGVVTWSLLIWGTTMREMKAVEFFYGLFLASEVAYYSYIYAKVEKKHYQKVTSHTRAAILLGKAIAGLSSQFLVYLNFNYLELNYFSIFGVGVTMLVAFFLPSVPQSIYFHQKNDELSAIGEESDKKPNESAQFTSSRCRTAFYKLGQHFKEAFTNIYVLLWSTWWALATCGYLQAISYCQLLWQDIIQENYLQLYHGYVEFAYAATGAAVAFGVGYLNVKWSTWGEIFLGVLTITQGCLLYYSAFVKSLYVEYAIFIFYRDFYEAAITIATYEVAKFINKDSYALVFGFNTFVALVVQSILTGVVVEALQVDIRHQYQIYGGYHFTIGGTFFLYGILKLILAKRRK